MLKKNKKKKNTSVPEKPGQIFFRQFLENNNFQRNKSNAKKKKKKKKKNQYTFSKATSVPFSQLQLEWSNLKIRLKFQTSACTQRKDLTRKTT